MVPAPAKLRMTDDFEFHAAPTHMNLLAMPRSLAAKDSD